MPGGITKRASTSRRSGTAAAPKTKAASKKTVTTTKAKAKPAAEKPAKAKSATTSRKRKSREEDKDDSVSSPGPAKKARVVKHPKSAKASTSASAATTAKIGDETSGVAQTNVRTPINEAPSEVLQVFVFGDGDMGTLGLGPKLKAAPRPKLNPFLDPSKPSGFQVVQLDCGGLHVIALTKDNKILTWGVNDNHALGRDATWDGEKLRDMDADNSSADEDDDLNPLEATPTPIPATSFPPATKFTQVAAGDNLSLALTSTGDVYGWGTFCNSEGHKTFGYVAAGAHIETQKTPVLISGLKNISKIVCGSNHCLALSSTGQVFSWGIPDENRLGRRLSPRFPNQCYTPHPVLKSAKSIFAGNRHSFAIGTNNKVWSWGLNSFGEAGSNPKQAGSTDFFHTPREIQSLRKKGVKFIAGGAHHSAVVTENHECLLWGKLDAGQLGINFSQDQLADSDLILRGEARNDPRICLAPTPIATTTTTEEPEPLKEIISVACGTEHTIFVNADGKAFSSGFGFQGQLGVVDEYGEPPSDDVMVARPIKAKSIRDVKLKWAGAGSNFSVLTAVYEEKKSEVSGKQLPN